MLNWTPEQEAQNLEANWGPGVGQAYLRLLNSKSYLTRKPASSVTAMRGLQTEFNGSPVSARIQILSLLQQHGPLRWRDIRDGVGMTGNDVARNLLGLRSRGLVAKEGEGMKTLYRITDTGIQFLKEKNGR